MLPNPRQREYSQFLRQYQLKPGFVLFPKVLTHAGEDNQQKRYYADSSALRNQRESLPVFPLRIGGEVREGHTVH
jgi:hypothetical protein